MPIYPNYQNYSYQQQPQTGFVTVRTEDDARNYPVAPGNSITFMSENAPFVYTKTMGFNQLDRPTFKKYRLVEEDNAQNQAETEKATNTSSEDLKAEYERIWSEIEHSPEMKFSKESEFLDVCKKADLNSMLEILDEHMDVIKVLHPKEYQSLIERIQQ